VSALALTLGWIARATGGTLRGGDPAAAIGDVIIDSRKVRAGDLFVALKGPRFDAHDFVGEVLAHGAAAAVVDAKGDRSGGPSGPPGAVIAVGDTLQALQDLAHAVRREAGTRVIAITGSAGKTTTRKRSRRCSKHVSPWSRTRGT
jgi:UDP-N-acetylmuramoyl-tripeptide--D-alanyl-D-alanine ligase